MMRLTTVLLLSSLTLPLVPRVQAQAGITVSPESRVILHGRSNVNSFSCATSTFQTSIRIDSAPQSESPEGRSRSVVRLTVAVPVRSLDCGRARMNEDMFRALKADSFPEIRYVLTRYRVEEHSAGVDSVVIHSVGELTVAGVTQRIELQVHGYRNDSGSLRGAGGARLLMTDFGIRPPTAFLGAIRTKNSLEVQVEIRASRRALAALP
jgi:polyisoprenoid-binding protein YceI